MLQRDSEEEFKPIPVRRGDGLASRALFSARLLLDLQLLTCLRFLKKHIPSFKGKVLDVGCGEMPFRGYMPQTVSYTGIDVPAAREFGMEGADNIVSFDGIYIPFPDESFDGVLCTEVLEHAIDPKMLVAEMFRVLKPNGVLIGTIPFSARVHHAPYDFRRYTSYGIEKEFSRFASLVITERGDDFAVIANKVLIIAVRLLKPGLGLLWRLPMLLIWGPFVLALLILAHLSLLFGLGSKADPLGYGIVARKLK